MFRLGLISFVILSFLVHLGTSLPLQAASFDDAIKNNKNHKHNFSSSASYTTVRTVDGSSNPNHPYAKPSALGGTERICVFCHTPHGAEPQSPLWSRPDPDSMGSFPLYNAALAIKGDYPSDTTLDDASQYKASDPSITYPNGASKLCLSCHDGVTAIGAQVDGISADIQMQNVSTVPAFSVVDLATSHPISFVYSESVKNRINAARLAASEAAGQYRRPDDVTSPLGFDVVPLDAQQRMQCTTCHDPHNDTGLDPALFALGLPFWRNTQSLNPYDDVCDSCHALPASTTPPRDHGLQ